jgi:hypothetical protein
LYYTDNLIIFDEPNNEATTLKKTFSLYRAKLCSHLWNDYVRHNPQFTPTVNTYQWLDKYPNTRYGPHHLWSNSDGIATMKNPNNRNQSLPQLHTSLLDDELPNKIHEVHLPHPSPLPPIQRIELSSQAQQSLTKSLQVRVTLNMIPSPFLHNLGPRNIMSLVLETLDECHISVPLANLKHETQTKQSDILFKEHFRRLRIARPDYFQSSTPGGSTTPLN